MAHTEKNLLGRDTFFDYEKMPSGPSYRLFMTGLLSKGGTYNRGSYARGLRYFHENCLHMEEKLYNRRNFCGARIVTYY